MGLLENMHNEPVSELALREPVTTTPNATIREAISAMRAKKLGCVIVIDEHRRPQGMFTESMLTQLLVENPQAIDDAVAKHTAPQWPHVDLSDRIEVMLDALHLKNVRFLSVVNEQDQLVGLTGQKGLMEYVADNFPGEVMVQRIGGSPFPDKREGA